MVMSLLNTLARMIDNDSQNYVQFDIPPERVKNVKYNPRAIVAGCGYFRYGQLKCELARELG